MRAGTPIFGRADLVGFAAVTLGVLAIRVAAIEAGMSPDPTVVAELWQNLDPARLAADFAGELWALHAQPPLWNALLGLLSRACGGDELCVTDAAWGINMALTPAIAAAMGTALRVQGAGPVAAWGAAALFALGPSALLYETFALYAQTAAALAAFLTLALARLPQGRGWLWAIYLAAAALCLLWSLFHPVFILVVLAACALTDRAAAFSRLGLLLAAAALIVSLAPSVKNEVRHGLFSNGTWVGLNLAQTAVRAPEDAERCSFGRLRAEIEARHPGIRDPLHDEAVIPLSKECLASAKAGILARPLAWTKGRLDAAVVSHSLWPYEFKYYHPLGWERLPIVDRSLGGGPDAPWERAVGWGILAWYIAIAAAAAGLLVRGRFGPQGGYVVALILLIAFFTAIGHAANGEEQNRMRHTIEPWWLMLAALSLEAARGRLSGSRAP